MTRRPRATALLAVSLLVLALGACTYAVSAMMSKLAQTPAVALPTAGTAGAAGVAPRGAPAFASPAAQKLAAGAAAPSSSPGLVPVPGSASFADTLLPGSSVVTGEPSLLLGGDGRVVVTGPTGIGHPSTISASPAWVSADRGRSFRGPIPTETGGQTAAGIGGGDSDIIADHQGDLYLTNLWLGNTTMAVSTDAGDSWTQLPVGHLSPADDRPWLAYDPTSDALYMAWDGFDGIHVGKTLLRAATRGTAAAPPSGLVFLQDVVAVPEVIASGTPAGSTARECVCPPGTIAVDPRGGVHVAFSSQFGLGVASSSDGGLTWSTAYVPDSGDGKAQDLANNFQVLRSDSAGNLYVVWSRAGARGDVVLLSWLVAGATTWHAPVSVSISASGLFGTLAVAAPGSVDIAYYGTDDFPGDPNSAPAATRWDVYMTQLRDLFSSSPTALVTDVYQRVHTGAISTGGITGGADRSLGDFFSLAVDDQGLACMVTAVGDAGSGTTLHYLHQTSPLVPAAPAVANDASPSTTPPSGGGAAAAYPAALPTYPPQTSLVPGPSGAAAPAPAGEGAPGSVPPTPTPGQLPDIVALSRPDAREPARAPTAVPLYLPVVLLLAVPAVLGALLVRRRRR
jgi:hypothetical protein